MTKEELKIACDTALDNVVSEAKAMEAIGDPSDPSYLAHKKLSDEHFQRFTELMNEFLKG